MSDSEHDNELDKRVNDIDKRLTVVETGVRDFREESRQGFSDIKMQLNHLYEERAEWGKVAREIVRKLVMWLMWLIPALIGLRWAAERFLVQTGGGLQ